jgi:hypothetical protein
MIMLDAIIKIAVFLRPKVRRHTGSEVLDSNLPVIFEDSERKDIK